MGNKINPNLFRTKYLTINNQYLNNASFFNIKDYSKYIYIIYRIQQIILKFFKKKKLKLSKIRFNQNLFYLNNNKIFSIFVNIFILHRQKHLKKLSLKKYIIFLKKNKSLLYRKLVNYLKKNKLNITTHLLFNQSERFFYFIETIFEKIDEYTNYQNLFKEIENNISTLKIQGLHILISGRLDDTDKALHLRYKYGRLNIQTIKSNLFYIKKVKTTKKGLIGIKFWINIT